MLLTTPHITAPAHRRGGWTQIFGVKASEPQTSRPVVIHDYYLPHLHLAPLLGMIPSRLAVMVQLRLVTDGQTDGHAMTANTA